MINKLTGLEDKVLSSVKTQRVAVAWAQDTNTMTAVARAAEKGIIEAVLVGKSDNIKKSCDELGIDSSKFDIVESGTDAEAARRAVAMTRAGDSDIVMKGLVGTDKFLREVMDREKGLMLQGAVLSYVCAVDVPAYHKLLFVTDTAVIPFPDLDQKIAMARYAIKMAQRFGVTHPKVALIGASEKMSHHFPNTTDYAVMCKMAERGQLGSCIIDGPLDLFLACDSKSIEIKGVETPVNGDADILLFPSLEACNPFYKGLMLFAGAELAGLIMGTSKPVIVMSRSESEKSKYYCILLACLMA